MGKTLGQMTPEERRQVTERALDRFQAELTASALAISRVLDEFELEQQARADAERDFAAVMAQETPEGHCTGCGFPDEELVPWSGQRLCWGCTDIQLDLAAASFLADAPVHVAVAR